MSILLSITVPGSGRDRHISPHRDELGAVRLYHSRIHFSPFVVWETLIRSEKCRIS